MHVKMLDYFQLFIIMTSSVAPVYTNIRQHKTFMVLVPNLITKSVESVSALSIKNHEIFENHYHKYSIIIIIITF